MTSTTKWEKTIKPLKDTLFVFLADYFESKKLEVVKSSIDNLLINATQAQSNELVSKINKVLKQGHGGGNWKRLIIQLQGEGMKPDEDKITKSFDKLLVGDIIDCGRANREVLAKCGKMIAVSRALSPGHDGWWTEETLRDKKYGQGWNGKVYLADNNT